MRNNNIKRILFILDCCAVISIQKDFILVKITSDLFFKGKTSHIKSTLTQIIYTHSLRS